MHQITDRWIENVELDISIDEKQFTLEFPEDTIVYDYSNKDQ